MKVKVLFIDLYDGVDESYIEVDEFTPTNIALELSDGEVDRLEDGFGKVTILGNTIITRGETLIIVCTVENKPTGE